MDLGKLKYVSFSFKSFFITLNRGVRVFTPLFPWFYELKAETASDIKQYL